MRIRHLGLAAASVASATLTLTAFGATAASAAPQATRAGSAVSAAPSAADCGGNPYHLRVLQAIDASPSGKSLTAQNTKYSCGDDDGYFTPVGKPRKFAFAPGAKATLLNGIHSQKVSLTDLLQRVHACKTNSHAVNWPASCNSQYVITVNKAGAITTIAQRYHP
ncbi:hypothetical protein [Kitasatospora sp. GP82]|uniref:hypothetical protein n=1 Tax=Kitasatospora sp. GP82 TaxID=3035089 RepID=UPI002473FCB7|nr:hypothetical protein [Kitasatospora sp. GP82]MDH6130097.1 hypothetical protein [Kitasatospora sp. GP82]